MQQRFEMWRNKFTNSHGTLCFANSHGTLCFEAFEEVARNLELVLVPNAEHQEVTGDPMFVEAILDFFERHPVSDPEARQ